jgi:hypothetical protein
MFTSEALVVTAIFASVDECLGAAQEMCAKGIPDEHIRVSAGCVLHVRITDGELNRVSSELRGAGAKDLSVASRAADPGWMSHVTDRVTGAQVMPGEGDSEAGPEARRT